MKSVVVLSGGQDSCTTLALAASESEVRGCIHFRYGQRHGVELECARHWASRYGLPLEIAEVGALSTLGNSGLVESGDISAQHPTLKHLPASFVPGRNLIFLTLAAAYAMKLGAQDVYTGVCETDYSGYPDCRRATVDALEAAIRLGMDFPELSIKTPLMYLSKAATFELAERLGVLDDVLENTHTCYQGDRSTRHAYGYGCGLCPACRVRERGWKEYVSHRGEAVA